MDSQASPSEKEWPKEGSGQPPELLEDSLSTSIGCTMADASLSPTLISGSAPEAGDGEAMVDSCMHNITRLAESSCSSDNALCRDEAVSKVLGNVLSSSSCIDAQSDIESEAVFNIACDSRRSSRDFCKSSSKQSNFSAQDFDIASNSDTSDFAYGVIAQGIVGALVQKPPISGTASDASKQDSSVGKQPALNASPQKDLSAAKKDIKNKARQDLLGGLRSGKLEGALSNKSMSEKASKLETVESMVASDSNFEPGRTMPEPCAEVPPKSEIEDLHVTIAEPEPEEVEEKGTSSAALSPTKPNTSPPTKPGPRDWRTFNGNQIRLCHDKVKTHSRRTIAHVPTMQLIPDEPPDEHELGYPDLKLHEVVPCGRFWRFCPCLGDAPVGNNAHGFSIAPPLPDGLIINEDTGDISGKATTDTPQQTYEVRCFLGKKIIFESESVEKEEARCLFRFATLSPPTNLRYPRVQRILEIPPPPIAEGGEFRQVLDGILPAVQSKKQLEPSFRRSFRRFRPDVKFRPTFKAEPLVEGGTVSCFKISPAPPRGVELDKKTGEVCVIPEGLQGVHINETFTISAINAVGMVTCAVHLDVAHGSWDLVHVEFSSGEVNGTGFKDESDGFSKRKSVYTSGKLRHTLEPQRLGTCHGQCWGAEIDWIRTAEKAVAILDRFGQTMPSLDDEQSSVWKGMGASALLKCLGLEETKTTLKNLMHAIGIANNGGSSVLTVSESQAATGGSLGVSLIDVGPEKEPLVCLHLGSSLSMHKRGAPHKISKLSVQLDATLGQDQSSSDSTFASQMPAWRSRFA
eukprot:gnl/MRDRNA2_/MRDRNA2_57337_c0_seq1.p1 gnl/MRDRNA2_/MRDRNA2_57337_c0~~gnl/MRDRNA2_/MRDRNA2_57337_c0_seq1.p1  ORF type:complete len:802 (-),score=126.65 gnl/MRDRNA2_/MRDRNA2_57337_c0_seq1:37-2442(-)